MTLFITQRKLLNMNWLRICFLVLLVVSIIYAQNRRCGRPCSQVSRPICARNAIGRRTFENVCQMARFNCLQRTSFRLINRGRCVIGRPAVIRPAVIRPAVARPGVARPIIVRPIIVRPIVVRPIVVRPPIPPTQTPPATPTPPTTPEPPTTLTTTTAPITTTTLAPLA